MFFFILDYAVEQRNLERAVIYFSLFVHRKLRYINRRNGLGCALITLESMFCFAFIFSLRRD